MRRNHRAPIIPILLLLLVVTGAFLLFWRQRVAPVRATLDPPPIALGTATPLRLELEAARGGLLWAELRLRRGEQVVTAHRHDFSGPPTNTAELEIVLRGGDLGLEEGELVLEIHARDAFWRPLGPSDEPALTLPLVLDLTPPTLRWEGGTGYPQQGGAGIAILATTEEARVGVQVGELEFEAHPAGGAGSMVALYGIPFDHPAERAPVAFAEDPAGNRREFPLPVTLRPKRFERGAVTLNEDFLARKLPELLPGENWNEENYAEGFLILSQNKRQEAAQQKRRSAEQTDPRPLWTGAFVQPRNTRVFSDFATTRDYRYEGRALDTQVHMGFDLASVRNALVPAANTGRVVFAAPLNIYGNTVILDHGLGLQTLYAHLSSIEVAEGERVEREQVLGRTGTSGLAVGDHLHFEVLVGGLPVNPLQWWDRQWIENHVREPLVDAGLAGFLPGP